MSTHRLSRHPLYSVYKGMMARCHNPKAPNFYLYGGRQIEVCARWRGRPDRFIADMGPTYAPGLSLDRINTMGNYTPRNCRWATPLEQMNNRRDNNRLALNGVDQTLSAWSRTTGIPRSTIRSRQRAGWPAAEILRRESREALGRGVAA